ncbi:hypothetical protein Glove_264g39 [Diversispora epigaea]|uniref:Uncharacterized protein n=1 Tax=Diversispora epigaea TaxID=1348612 RepID=A0A397I5F6_9GLOM|nr:hypothetical protein Glove_264g39 [Diversispora epigaea]
MRCIKEYTCHIEQRASNFPITEEGLFHWLLKAKHESLPQELQNRGIFPDIESIIRYKDIPTIHVPKIDFGFLRWKMVDFLNNKMVEHLENKPKKTLEEIASNFPITEEGLFHWLLKAKHESLPQELQNRGIFPDIESIIRYKDIPTIHVPKIDFGFLRWKMVDFLNNKMVEHLENKPKKTLEEMYALNCYGMSLESLTEEFITDYGKYDHMKWFKNLQKLRDAGTNNETAVEAIIHEEYRNDRLITVIQAKKHRICLELLKTCTPVKDIDDRNMYKVNDVKTRLNSPESIQYLQNLVPKMTRVFNNTDAFRSAKKSGLKSDKAKLGLLNSVLSAIYGIKFKTTNNKNMHYHLVGAFNNEDAPKLSPYQTGKGLFYESGEDIRYGYSKLSPDKLELPSNSISQETQDLFDIC